MKKNVKKQQKEILSAYLADLKGINAIKAEDIMQMIEQAKALKDMCYKGILKGNTEIMRFFTDYSKLIMECYNNMPEQSIQEEEKKTIEDAINILFSESQK